MSACVGCGVPPGVSHLPDCDRPMPWDRRDPMDVAVCSFELGMLSGLLMKDGAKILSAEVQESSVYYKRGEDQYRLTLRRVSA